MKSFFFDEVNSTNDEIWKMERSENESICLISSRQIKGKGTQGKSWVSDEGNFYGSFLQTFKLVEPQTAFSILVGIRTIRVLKSLCDESLKLMWPNDLIVEREDGFRKIGGILCESKIQGNNIELVMGIGININSFPSQTEKPAGKIQIELNQLIERMIGEFSVCIDEEKITQFSEYDFFKGKKIKTYNGKVGIGIGMSELDNSYVIKIGSDFVKIKDPERPILA